jgi:hypothetical protein
MGVTFLVTRRDIVTILSDGFFWPILGNFSDKHGLLVDDTAMPDVSSSSDEGDAPESFSLVQSKRAIRGQDNIRQKVRAAENQKKKDANRERDRKLKERSAIRKGKSVAGLDDDAEARMERAMQEAQEEMDESGNDDGVSDEEFTGFGMDKDESASASDEEESGGDDDGNMPAWDGTSSPADRSVSADMKLPDHLFTSVAAAKSLPIPKSQSRTAADDSSHRKKRIKTQQTANDIVIG